ncbi:MAG: hypothetical protein MK188_09380 [Gammaproteobacteria bacterium]|nr:hypothetical protein [Gammaproteobacteria bacterium]
MCDKQSLFNQGSVLESCQNQGLEINRKLNSERPEQTRLFSVLTLAKRLPLVLFSISILLPNSLLALGLGGVETKSYIGQPLLVEIPLYNVESPSGLKIKLERVDGESSEGLTANLSRENSQLSVVIRSDDIVNEPYFNFALNLDDQGNFFRKELTVLLDLSPTQNALLQSPKAVPSNTKDQANSALVTGIDTGNSDTMGPYDWAQAGAIPKRFGAVLDGQALWRVARRISPAMGVSNNQMMWALYNANPSAFANDKIESLKAGVYLDIPNELLVKSVSDAQAKQLLNDIKPSRLVETEVVNPSPQPEQVETIDNQPDLSIDELIVASAADSAPIVERFQLTGLEERVSSDGALIGAQDSGSQEIINSLAQTVSSLTEQLSKKDKQIIALQEQVIELKSFIQASEDLPIESLQLASRVAAIEELQAGPQNSRQLSSIQPAPGENQQRLFAENWNMLPWLLFGILVAVVFLMRDRFVGFWRTLNYSGRNDGVDFQGSDVTKHSLVSHAAEDETHERYKSAKWRTEEAYERILNRPSASHGDEMDFASFEDTSFHMSESEFSSSEFNLEDYSEMALDEDEAPAYEPASDEPAVSFQERFGQLIAQGDSELASQLLDLARGNQVSAFTYHYHKLQLLSLEKSQDPFYSYYGEIEPDLAKFPKDLQTDISKLVVRMSQRSYDFG